MGMQYNVSFNDAIIPEENIPLLMEWVKAIDGADADLTREGAIECIRYTLESGDSGNEPVDTETEGIDLDMCGYYNSAGYGFGDTLRDLLQLCKPGAYLHWYDTENDGEQYRDYWDGETLTQVIPEVTWQMPNDEPKPVYPDPATYPRLIAVNIWDAGQLGNGEETGMRFTVYEDDPDSGVNAGEWCDSGPFPQGGGDWVQSFATEEDDWLYGVDAYQFMMHVWAERALPSPDLEDAH